MLDSPSKVSATDVQASTSSLLTIVRLMQRKVYRDANYSNAAPKVPATLGKDLLPSCTLHGGRCSTPSIAQSMKMKRDV